MPRYLVRKHTQKKYIRSTINRKISKTRKNTKQKSICGGGIWNNIINQTHNSSTLPFGLGKFDPSKYLRKNNKNPNMYRALYNYGSPYQIELTFNKVLLSSNVINKPHLFMPDLNHYLISLIENPGKPDSRLLWIASYKNRSWERDILSYIPPSPEPGKILAYALLVYNYPLDISVNQIYKPLDMTTTKRNEEYRNFQIYLAANKMIQAIPGLTKYFRVKYDTGNALSFLSNALVGKTKSGYGSVRQDKDAVRLAPPRMEMKGMNKKFEKLER
jgi:hypothetical protein